MRGSTPDLLPVNLEYCPFCTEWQFAKSLNKWVPVVPFIVTGPCRLCLKCNRSILPDALCRRAAQHIPCANGPEIRAFGFLIAMANLHLGARKYFRRIDDALLLLREELTFPKPETIIHHGMRVEL